ncbi:MAG: hypothetical protein VYE24_00910 [Acidobacteriota bacterium]|nr:hypothetical protein [Acidobacteriota bacterium]
MVSEINIEELSRPLITGNEEARKRPKQGHEKHDSIDSVGLQAVNPYE